MKIRPATLKEANEYVDTGSPTNISNPCNLVTALAKELAYG